jgi:hypothetical protein
MQIDEPSASREKGLVSEVATLPLDLGERAEGTAAGGEGARVQGAALARIACFFGMIAALVFGLDSLITYGLRQIKTSQFGVSNRVMRGAVNAEIVITGSSRALSHYDPRILQSRTGYSAFNLGRNGSQTDVQVAVLKAYLEHNRKPKIIIHNLDSFSFEATRQVYNPVQYVPYLYDEELYQPLRRIDHQKTWKWRNLPLYGYLVDDMGFSWMLGIGGALGWSPAEDYYMGFNPRSKGWTDEFTRFKAMNSGGVTWPVDAEGQESIDELIRICRQQGIELILVYSPEYAEMQKLVKNRAKIFTMFHELAEHNHLQFWDYSGWKHSDDTGYFTNSQHLNAAGAKVFSGDLSEQLRQYLDRKAGTDMDLLSSK